MEDQLENTNQLAVGNKPQGEISFSSQDILSSSVAGNKRDLFTRIKRKKDRDTLGLKPKGRAQQPLLTQKATKRPSKKVKIIIWACVAFIVLLAGVTLVIVWLSSNPNNNSLMDPDPDGLTTESGEPDVAKIVSSVQGLEIDSEEAAKKFNQNASFLTDIDNSSVDLVDSLYQQYLDEAFDPDIVFELKIGYARFLIGTKRDMVAAENILNEVAADESSSQEISLAGAYRYLYQEASEHELYEQYDELLNELNNSESTEAEYEGEAPNGTEDEEN